MLQKKRTELQAESAGAGLVLLCLWKMLPCPPSVCPSMSFLFSGQPSLTEWIFTNLQPLADQWLEIEVQHKQQAEDPHRARLLAKKNTWGRIQQSCNLLFSTLIYTHMVLQFFAGSPLWRSLFVGDFGAKVGGLLQLWAPELFEEAAQPEMPLVSANWLWAALSNDPKAALADMVALKSDPWRNWRDPSAPK